MKRFQYYVVDEMMVGARGKENEAVYRVGEGFARFADKAYILKNSKVDD